MFADLMRRASEKSADSLSQEFRFLRRKMELLAWFSDPVSIEPAKRPPAVVIFSFLSLSLLWSEQRRMLLYSMANSHRSHPIYETDELPCGFHILVWWGKFVDITFSAYLFIQTCSN
uniref:Uncharacterized protein n=1 Tax=Arundo donax TaxID=35708 RepID=A0A0A9E8Y0_ARUDO